MSKTRKLIAAIDFNYGPELKKAEKEFLAAVEDVENLVSRGLAYVKGQEPIPVNSGMQDPINPAKEAKKQALVKLHLNADPGSAQTSDSETSSTGDGSGAEGSTPDGQSGSGNDGEGGDPDGSGNGEANNGDPVGSGEPSSDQNGSGEPPATNDPSASPEQ